MIGPDVDDFGDCGQFILPLYTEDRDGALVCIGSSVVICVAKERALAFTALHNISYVMDMHDHNSLSELNIAPDFRLPAYAERFQPFKPEDERSLPREVFTIMPDKKAIAVVISANFFPGQELDIAALCFARGTGVSSQFQMHCSIASNGPKVGDEVLLCGFPAGNKILFNRDAESFEIDLKQERLVGIVTERFGWGEDYLVRSPGFRVNIGAPSGLSGGAVLRQDAELGLQLCGIISAADEDRTTAAILYPALALANPIPHGPDVPDSLLGLCSFRGGIIDKDDAPTRLKIIADPTMLSLRQHVLWV
jgi:hypothetical protein